MALNQLGGKGDGGRKQPTPDELVDQAFEEYSNSFNSPEEKVRIRTTVENVLSRSPGNPKAHVLLGYLEMDSGNLNGMYRHFVKALDTSTDPCAEYTWDYVIMCLDDGLRDYPRLADYLTRFYEKKPETYVVEYLARTYLKLDEPQKALLAVSRHLASFPEDRKMRKLKGKIEREIH